MNSQIRTACFLLTAFSLSLQLGLENLVAQNVGANSLPKILPPDFEGDRKTIPFPESVDDIDVGGGGRFLALHFKTLRKIGVFDLSQLKIIHYVPADDDDTEFAAGATKLVVVSGDRGVVSRWDLAKPERELTQTIDLGGSAVHVLLGSSSVGPAIVSGSSPRGGGYHGGAFLVDLATLKATPLQSKSNRRGFGPGANVRISANGNVLGIWASGVSPSGLQTLVKSDDQWTGHYEHTSVGYIVPSPDGRLVYTGRGIYTNQLRRLGASSDAGFSIPAVHGPYYLTVSGGDSRSKSKERVSLKIAGDDRPLVTIPNLDPVFHDDDRWSRQTLTLDKRLFLIPEGEVIVQLANTKDKLIVAKLDIEEALKKSHVDYLLVTSRPPLQVKAGDGVRYQLEVKSKAGEVTYSLDSAPAGMQLSPTGLLAWKTTTGSPSKSNVIVTVSDKSGQQVFHTFAITVQGGGATAAGPANGGELASTSGAPESVKTTPVDLDGESKEIKLPGILSDVVVGGNGRYLFFHLKDLKKIAAFDVSEAKITTYLPASDDDTKVVAGATRVLIFSLTQGVVARYRMHTFERNLTVPVPFQHPIQYIGMGAGSEGPVMLRYSHGTGQIDRCAFAFMDINTMKPIDVKWPNGRAPHSVYRDHNTIRVSTNGEAFAVGGVGVLRLNGNMVDHQGNRSKYTGFPSANGKYFLANGRILNSDLQPMGDNSVNFGAMVPSVTGQYFLSLGSGSPPYLPSHRGSSKRPSGKLYMFGDNRPLVTIPDLLEAGAATHGGYRNSLGLDKRVFFVPDAKVIVTVPPTNDRIRLRRFDIDEALEASGVDYLVVNSQPPAQATLGKTYQYAISVKSKRGGVKYSLDAGPAGMAVSDAGKVTWPVPTKLDEATHDVIVTVSDASGQSVFHTFSIDIPEVKARQAAAPAEREDRLRIAGEESRRKAIEAQRLAAQARLPVPERTEAVQTHRRFQAEMRTWKDATGKFSVRATFVKIIDRSKVVLKLENGDRRTVSLSELSNQDIYEAVKSDLLKKGIR